MSRVFRSVSRRHEHFNFLARKFVWRIPEQVFCVVIRKQDDACVVNDQHGVWCGVKKRTEVRFDPTQARGVRLSAHW